MHEAFNERAPEGMPIRERGAAELALEKLEATVAADKIQRTLHFTLKGDVERLKDELLASVVDMQENSNGVEITPHFAGDNLEVKMRWIGEKPQRQAAE